jgi:hypothetical protein
MRLEKMILFSTLIFYVGCAMASDDTVEYYKDYYRSNKGHPFGVRGKITREDAEKLPVYKIVKRDKNGRIASIKSTGSGELAWDFSYTYHNNGSLASVTRNDFFSRFVATYREDGSQASFENLDIEIKENAKVLGDANRVESRLIGEEGKESEVFRAYDVIRSNSQAKLMFEGISKHGTSYVSKVYAYIWMFENDKEFYAAHQDFFINTTIVKVMIGDILNEYPLHAIQDKIESGELKKALYMEESGFE